MIESIAAWGMLQIGITVGGSVLAIFLTWLLKKIDTARIRKGVYDIFFGIGAAISKFFNGWKYTKAVWQNTLEPWLIGFLDMIFMAIMQGLFDGLRSDDKES